MALTKTANTQVDEWAEISQNTVREGAEVDVSGIYAGALHIDVAISNTTAHTGTEIIVLWSSNTTGDEPWTPLVRFIGPTGTAISVALANQEVAGQTDLGVTDPVTNNMDNNGKFKFIEAVTVANSEIVFQTANSGDAGDTITIMDGLTNQQETTSNIFDIDDATAEAVGQYSIHIPIEANRVKVIYNNTYDPDGATVHTHCRITKVTGV